LDYREQISRVNALVLQITDRLGSVAPLATRIVIGLAFFQAGTGKLSLDALLRKILRSEPQTLGEISSVTV